MNRPPEQSTCDLTYHDVLRELSAAFRVKPEDVSRVLDSIADRSGPGEKRTFFDGSFSLRYLNGHKGNQRVMVRLESGQRFCLEVVPYRGLVKLRAEMDEFGDLRILEDGGRAAPVAPDARPSEPYAAVPLSDPYNDCDFDETADIAPSTKRKVLSALEGPDSFRGLVFGEDDED